jgi:hypothetical protein
MVMDSQMKEQFESAADYRQRAEECRRKADASQDEWARATFLDASVEWEKLAKKKARRSAAELPAHVERIFSTIK